MLPRRPDLRASDQPRLRLEVDHGRIRLPPRGQGPVVDRQAACRVRVENHRRFGPELLILDLVAATSVTSVKGLLAISAGMSNVEGAGASSEKYKIEHSG